MAYLLPLLLLSAIRAEDPCASCATSTAPKGTCFSDGQLYGSDSCAQCANKDNFPAFRCPADLTLDCAATCAEQRRVYRCRANCNEPYVYSFACNSNGRVYSNRCREQCIDPDFTDVFRCNQFARFTNGDCNIKCARNYQCRTETAGVAIRSVCGKDGLLYRSFDEAKCNGAHIPITDSDGQPVFEGTDDCRAYVELMYGQAVGAPKSPVYFQSPPSVAK